MINIDDIQRVVEKYIGVVKNINFVPCDFEGKDFYDVVIVDIGDRKIFCKGETDYKGKGCLLGEYNITKYLIKKGFNVPSPIFYFPGNNDRDTKIAIYQYLDQYKNISSDDLNKEEVIKQIGLIMKNLHKLSIDTNIHLRSFGQGNIQKDCVNIFNKKREKWHKITNKELILPIDELAILFFKTVENINYTEPYVLCKKDMHKNNRMINNLGVLSFIDNEFFQIGPAFLDIYEIYTNLLYTDQQKERFTKYYGKENFKKNRSKELIVVSGILKTVSMAITYEKSGIKDWSLKKKIHDMIKNLL